MTHSELFKKVRRIEIAAKKYVLDIFSGMYASSFKGRGIEMEDIREFQTGDDIRAIHWAKTAQMGKPYVKDFRQERDLTVMLVGDVSGSFDFASHFVSKRERLAEIAALIAFSAAYNQDRVGLMLFSSGVEKIIHPRRGPKHAVRLVRELIAFEPTGRGTDLAQALDTFNKTIRRRCIAFLLSDFLAEGFEKSFMRAARKNDFLAIRLFDPLESEAPSGCVTVEDLESGEKSFFDLSEKASSDYKKSWEKKEKAFEALVKKGGGDFLNIQTKGSFIEQLIAYFTMRKRRL